MSSELQGMTIAFLATDGVEQSELEQPWRAVLDAGGQPRLVALEPGSVQAFQHHDKGEAFPVDATVQQAAGSAFNGLVLPGGVISPDALRMHEGAMGLVRQFVAAGRPIAAICHGPWSLVEVDAVRGRTLTSWPSLRTDIRNAGGTWVDEQAHRDGTLLTSRRPDDLPAFCAALVDLMADDRRG